MDDDVFGAPPSRRRSCAAFMRALALVTIIFAVFIVAKGLAWATGLAMVPTDGHPAELRNIVYLTGQHPLLPAHLPEFQYLTHMALAFMPSHIFNDPVGQRAEWPLFTTVKAVRQKVNKKTKLLVAIGGWGDTDGFSQGARSDASRARFARNVAAMVAATGADGVDIDWEYPGGNGEDYKQVPNEQKAWEIEAYLHLLAAIRKALGRGKIISAAVPGKPEDMLAFTPETLPYIMRHVDFLNVMTYDLMNRRDSVTTHHTGVTNSLAAVDAYIEAGCDPEDINLGLAFYVKYYKTEHEVCLERVRQGKSPLGCRTLQLEDPDTGADLGRAGAFSWHDRVPKHLSESFVRALADGVYDEDQGGYYYWDDAEDLWWSYDTPEAIEDVKFPLVLLKRRLGGVFAWGLGEDAPLYTHFQAMGRAWKHARDVAGRDSARDQKPASATRLDSPQDQKDVIHTSRDIARDEL